MTIRFSRAREGRASASAGSKRRVLLRVLVQGFGLCLLLTLLPAVQAQAAPCDPPITNPIACENTKPGNPPSEWDVSGGGSSNIEGFATDISVDQGQTIQFKVDTNSSNYRIDIYRLGYYGGLGARRVATVEPSAALPQNQPSCLSNATTGLIDCGNWSVSASWAVPSDAVSGVYLGKLVREDGTSGSNHIPFIVRDDDGHSDLLFQTSDTTWQAYNQYGGNSLYVGNPAGRAYKVSYNRPFTTRSTGAEDWVFNAEYPMIRFLERNGYNVSYFTGVDAARRGAELLEHKVYMSVGHDEYWAGSQRTNVEAARAAGVNLAFFSGNEVFWKTRWEPSIDASATAFRTLVSYKETHANEKIDPSPEWTGTWRDPRFSPPADGGRPENGLTGTIFTVNDPGTFSIQVPAEDGRMRFWRNTNIATLAPGQVATLEDGTLGYEWDEDLDNGFRPAGVVRLSTSTFDVPSKLQDYGSSYGPGTATHHLTLYRAPSGALVFGAGTVQWSWGLDGNHDRGTTTPDGRMQQATVNLFADMGSQPATLQPGLAPAAASTDATAPTAALTSPSDGSTVQVGTSVAITGTAADAGGGVVGGVEVSVDGGTTWHPANGRESWSYSWIPQAAGTVTIRARAVDDSGNIGSPSQVRTVTVQSGGPGPGCPCSIWNDATVPALQSDSDAAAVEVGVKFQSSVDGYITALRFFKGSANTGTHIGHLWTRTGTLVATVTFQNESASGWQQQRLATPVPVTAGTTYVASYHTDVGRYSADTGYFAGRSITNGPLRALADGDDGPNGVYQYGPSGFPTDTFGSTNYWVDVVLDQTATDTQPPRISNRFPLPGTTGVATTTNVTATFDEPVDPASIGFALRGPGNTVVPANVTYDAPSRTARLSPNAELQLQTTYTATVSGVRDQSGNVMTSPDSWSFTTTSTPPPPPDEGPGGPILVIASPSNPFSRYYAEILRAEGFNEFAVRNIGSVDATLLANYDVAILGEMSVSPSQVTTLTNWVNAGGNLIAMRPDKQLAGLLGLTDAASTLGDAYLQVNTAAAPGRGITGQTIQFHGTADRYSLSGASSVATLYSSSNTATANPAVSLRSVGTNGGQAAAFTFDLARSIVYTRQGNPAWAGQERDGFAPIRSDDMFFPDWIDFNKVAIPQADEQQRLLANLIEHMNFDRKPLPRFWYFPRSENAVVVMTGDDHGHGGTVGRFNSYLAGSTPGCSVVTWDCIRATSYIYTNTPLSDGQAANFVAQGFEIGLHVDVGCADFTPTSIQTDFTNQLADFSATFPSVPAPSTNRTHCIVFSDWDTEPKVELAHGIRLDANYYYWPPTWIEDRPGFFTGSGMPMRFASPDGTLIDEYQAATQMTDESGQSYPATINALLDGALGPNGYYGAFTANIHTDDGASTESDAIIASAKARGVPIISARQLLDWVDGRNGSTFGSITWNNNVLSFSVNPAAGSEGLRTMVPMDAAPGRLTGITRSGSPITFSTQTVKGVDYAFFPAQAGTYQVAYSVDTTPPVITNVVASPQPGGTAAISWTTNEASNSRVDYGTVPGSLDLSASDGGSVTSHNVTLTGLTAGTTYYYRVRSADAAGNASFSPPTANPPASFVTPLVSMMDTTVADFTAGQGDTGSYVGQTGDGEVLLAPTAGSEFSGTGLPAGWTATPWQTGGSATVGGGAILLDGASSGTTGTFGAGHVLEFVGTFSGAAHQHVGFGVDFNSQPWAMFSTAGGAGLSARTNGTSTSIAGNWFGSPHLFRVQWTSTGVMYFIDGQQVASHAVAIATPMRPLISDFDTGGGGVSVDWMRMDPYAAAGTFTSRVFDAGGPAAWGAATWNADVPPGTSQTVTVRTGNSPTPDGTWSTFAPLAASGASVGANARYLQYRVSSTTAGSATPVFRDISFQVSGGPPGPDTTPPTITAVTPAPAANGTSATITWTTNEPSSSRVDYGTSAGTLNQTTNDATPVTSHSVTLNGLTPGTTYFFRVRSTDGSTNEATSPIASDPPATFNTPIQAPPAITSIVATPGTGGATATITWTTDVASDSRVDYGTTSASLTTQVSNPSLVTAHSIGLTGLNAGTTYYFRVRSANSQGNASVSPVQADPPAQFVTPVLMQMNTTLADFSPGTTGSNTYVSQTQNGEVILDPTRAAEFAGTTIPGQWNSTLNQTGGSATVGQGVVTMDGARVGTSTTFGAGRTVEFVATFSGQANQNAGFGTNFSSRPWAAFGTNTGGALYARSSVSTTNQQDTLIAGNWLGAPHVFRIDWGATTITFWIDGVQVAQHTRTITTNMRPLASDLTLGSGNVIVDWMRMSPYSSSGTYTRVLDAGSTQRWDTVSWLADVPAGTTLVVSVRTGNTPTPGTGWTSFRTITTSGGSINLRARYLQYRIQMTRTNAITTPALREISFVIQG